MLTIDLEPLLTKKLWGESVSKAIYLLVNANSLDDEDQQSHFKHGELEMTTDTFGLFLAKSCTHNKPTCMHLKISISKHG